MTHEELIAIVRSRIAEALNDLTQDGPDPYAKVWMERYVANTSTLLDEFNRLRTENAGLLADVKTLERQLDDAHRENDRLRADKE